MLLAQLRANGEFDVYLSRRNSIEMCAECRHELLPFEARSNPGFEVRVHCSKVSWSHGSILNKNAENENVDTVESIVDTMYTLISGRTTAPRDWESWKKLHVAGAR